MDPDRGERRLSGAHGFGGTLRFEKNPFELRPDRRLDRVPRRPRLGATALVRDAV
jgi:hypothetical protein